MSLSFAEVLRKYSPDEPRDDHGRWTDGAQGDTAVQGLRLQQLRQQVKDEAKRLADGIKAGQDAIPASDREIIGEIAIKAVDNMDGPGQNNWIGQFYRDLAGDPHIEIATTDTMGFPNADPTGVTVHELGHALDSALNRYNLPGQFVWNITQDAAGLTKDMRSDAAYWLQNPKEGFAELYSLTFSPNHGKDARFFALPYPVASKVFAKSINAMRTAQASGWKAMP